MRGLLVSKINILLGLYLFFLTDKPSLIFMPRNAWENCSQLEETKIKKIQLFIIEMCFRINKRKNNYQFTIKYSFYF